MILRGTEENKQNNIRWSSSYQAFLASPLCLRHHLWVVLTLSSLLLIVAQLVPSPPVPSSGLPSALTASTLYPQIPSLNFPFSLKLLFSFPLNLSEPVPLKLSVLELPGGPVVKTLCSQCRGPV